MSDMFGVGALAGAGVQAAGATAAMRASVKDTRHSRQWQERMANTAYQRAVKDLELAGLNPVLATGHVNLAHTPQTQVPVRRNIGEGLAAVASSSAKSFSKLKKELEILNSQAEMTANQADASQFDKHRAYNAMLESANAAELRSRQASLTTAQEAAMKATTSMTDVQRRIEETRIPAAEAQADLDQTQFGEFMRKVNRVIRSATGSDNTSAR